MRLRATLLAAFALALAVDAGAEPASPEGLPAVLQPLPADGPAREAWRRCLAPRVARRVAAYCNNPPVQPADEGALAPVAVPGARLLSLTVLNRHGDRSAIHVLPGSARPDWRCGAPDASDAAWAATELAPRWSTSECLHRHAADACAVADAQQPQPPPSLVAHAFEQWRRVRNESERCSRHVGGELSSAGWAQLRGIGAALGGVPAYAALLRRDDPATTALAVGSTDTGRTMLSATALTQGFLEAATAAGAATYDGGRALAGEGDEGATAYDGDVGRRDVADVAAPRSAVAGGAPPPATTPAPVAVDTEGDNDEYSDGVDDGGAGGGSASAVDASGAASDGDNASAPPPARPWRRLLLQGEAAAARGRVQGGGSRNLHAFGAALAARYAAAVPQLGPLPLPLHVVDRHRDPAMFGSSPTAASCPGLAPAWEAERATGFAHLHMGEDVMARLRAAGMRNKDDDGDDDDVGDVGVAGRRVLQAAGGDTRVTLSQRAAVAARRRADAVPNDGASSPNLGGGADGPTSGVASLVAHEVDVAVLNSENAADDVLTRLCHDVPLPCFGERGLSLPLRDALAHYGCAASEGDNVAPIVGGAERCMRADDAATVLDTANAHYRARYAGAASRALMHPLLATLADRWRSGAAAAGVSDAAGAVDGDVRPPRVLLRAVHDTVIAPLSAALGLHDGTEAGVAADDGVPSGWAFLEPDVPEWWPRYASRLVFELWRIPRATVRQPPGGSGDSAADHGGGSGGPRAFVRVLRDGKDVTRFTACGQAVDVVALSNRTSAAVTLALCTLESWGGMAADLLAAAVGGSAGGAAAWDELCAAPPPS